MKDKQLLLGNDAVARGLYEAGVKVVSAYPGTPSTEITEAACKFPEIYTEWAPNEKVAYEVAFGATIGGARAFCAMKHVGLNVAADPLYTSSYIGVNAGMVCAVADDPGMHSSQNEQDSRHHAIASKVPMLEPSSAQECKDLAIFAYDLSERFDTPVLLRLSTRVSHCRGLVTLCDRNDVALKDYKRNIQKNVMMPAMARAAHVKVEARTAALIEFADKEAFEIGINKLDMTGSKSLGIIAAGSAYDYAREAVGDKACYLKLGMVNPLPVQAIKDFASKVDRVVVVEELDPIIENHCKVIGVKCEGKELFGYLGEFSQNLIKSKLGIALPDFDALEINIPPRPPALCAGCPHRGLFYALKKYGLYVSGDIGCYSLGAQAPLAMLDAVVCMGASVSGLHGYNLARGKDSAKKSIAVIGDSTFVHSGITGLIDIAYNKGISTVVVLDNSITGMTGHQNNPMNGLTIKGDPTVAINLEALAHAIGINRVRVVDPFDIEQVRKVAEEELATDEPSLIISRRPCALLKNVKHNAPYTVDNTKCIGCRACLQVGCPALSVGKGADGKPLSHIDSTLCLGCGVCASACKFGALKEGDTCGK